jgi:hypothetical protein
MNTFLLANVDVHVNIASAPERYLAKWCTSPICRVTRFINDQLQRNRECICYLNVAIMCVVLRVKL